MKLNLVSSVVLFLFTNIEDVSAFDRQPVAFVFKTENQISSKQNIETLQPSYVETTNDLRALSSHDAKITAVVIARGRDFVADGGGGIYLWNPSSQEPHDGCTIIRPDDVLKDGAGRWQRQERDRLNVRCFGARLDGKTDDSAAFSAARSAVAAGGIVDVPAGMLNLTSGVMGGPQTPILWRLTGNHYPDKTTPIYGIGTDIVETLVPGNGRYFSRSQTTNQTGAVVTVRQDITHTTPGNGVIPTLNTETYVLSNAHGQYSWNALHKLYDKSQHQLGNNVTLYSQYNRESGGTPGWGLVVEHRDKTNKPSSATASSVAAEFDLFGGGHDDGDRRVGIDMVIGRNNPAAEEFMEATTGFRTSSMIQKGRSESKISWFKRGFSAESGILETAFDASRATYIGKNRIALRVGSTNAIDMSTDGSRTLLWDSGSLQYIVNGQVVFRIDDNGDIATKRLGKLEKNKTIADSVPASSNAACQAGQRAWDNEYEYRCVDTNTWKRSALSSW